jgi:hypothetical protein
LKAGKISPLLPNDEEVQHIHEAMGDWHRFVLGEMQQSNKKTLDTDMMHAYHRICMHSSTETYRPGDTPEWFRNWVEGNHPNVLSLKEAENLLYRTSYLRGRKLFILPSGHIGTAHHSVQAGDIIILAAGAGCPLVLRVEGGYFRFVCSASVTGL